MTKYFIATTALVYLLATSNVRTAASFQITPQAASSVRSTQQSRFMTLSPLGSGAADAASTTTTEAASITTEETKALFYTFADSLLRIDPSSGTCCRSGCSGCSYLDEKTGDFMYEEYTSVEGEDVPAWIAPYDHSDVGRTMSKEAHLSKWSNLLFDSEDAKEVKKESFEEIITAAFAESNTASKIVSLVNNDGVEDDTTEVYEISAVSSPPSTEAIEALWGLLSPTPGLPVLTKSDIVKSLKTIQSSTSPITATKWGGAITYNAFSKALQSKASAIANGEWDGSGFIDYESMSIEDLQEIIDEREMRQIPKMKKFMIEELRFYDEHGRQGKRHPVNRKLS
uniref:Uncharacterized protein n=1 Tax=Ditylum brightwellii TaxID=49249 RepID=A0A7S4QGE6_9STRA